MSDELVERLQMLEAIEDCERCAGREAVADELKAAREFFAGKLSPPHALLTEEACKVCYGTRPIYCSGCMGRQMSIRKALENLIGAIGRRDPHNGSELLPADQQMGEVGDAMRALSNAKGEA